MLFFSLLCFITLVAPSVTYALTITIIVPSQVESPGNVTVDIEQDGRPDGSILSYSILNPGNASQTSHELGTMPNNNLSIVLSIPVLPEGGGWVIQAQSVNASNSTSSPIGTSNTFSIIPGPPLPPPPPASLPPISELDSGSVYSCLTNDQDCQSVDSTSQSDNSQTSGNSHTGLILGISALAILASGWIVRFICICYRSRARRSSTGPSRVEAGLQKPGAVTPYGSSASAASLGTVNDKVGMKARD